MAHVVPLASILFLWLTPKLYQGKREPAHAPKSQPQSSNKPSAALGTAQTPSGPFLPCHPSCLRCAVTFNSQHQRFFFGGLALLLEPHCPQVQRAGNAWKLPPPGAAPNQWLTAVGIRDLSPFPGGKTTLRYHLPYTQHNFLSGIGGNHPLPVFTEIPCLLGIFPSPVCFSYTFISLSWKNFLSKSLAHGFLSH